MATRRITRDAASAGGDAAPLLAGRYGHEGELGRGATARVMGLRDLAGARLVAKVLDPDAGARAMWELDVLASIDSPHLTRVVELLRPSTAVAAPFSIPRGAWVLVQARAEGDDSSETLAALDEARRGERLVSLIVGVARGLTALHARSLTHGDVKPENVLALGEHATLVDLGAAAPFGRYATISGTLAYMAPEAREGERSVATDLHALGATIFAWALGVPPPPGEPPALPPWVPPAVAALARELVSVRIGARPRDAEEVVSRLVPGSRRTHARSTARPAFVGGDETVARLVAHLDARGWAFVVGPSGSGRSRLVEETARELQRREAHAGREAPTYWRGPTLPWTLAAPALVHIDGADAAVPELERFLSAGRLAGHAHRVVVEAREADRASAVTLSPLSDDELRALMAAVTGESPTAATLAAAREATAGLAGRVVRAIDALASAGLDPHRATDWRSARWLERDERPWPRSTIALLEIASVLGGRLAIEGPWSDPELAEGARWAVREGLASIDPAGSLTLREDLVTPLDEGSRRRALARARALPISGLARAVLDAYSGAEAAAIAQVVRLARQARELGAPEDARDQLERFLAHAPLEERARRDLSRDLADACRAAGDLDAAERAIASEPGDAATSLLRGELARLTGRLEPARAIARELRDHEDPAVRAQALALEARTALASDADAARNAATQIDGSASPAAAARGAETLALLALAAGDPQPALTHAREGSRQAEAVPELPAQRAASARLASVEAQALTQLGRLAEARERHETSARLARLAGERLLEATCLVNAGLASLEDGELGAALVALESGARLLARLGRVRELARATANLANVAGLVGDDARARTSCDEAAGPAEASGDREASALIAIVRSELAVRQGKLRSACATLDAVRAHAGSLRPIVVTRLAAARALTGDCDSGAALLASLSDECREDPRVDAEHALADARVALSSGDPYRAGLALTRARGHVGGGAVGLELRVRTMALELEMAEAAGARSDAQRALASLRALLEPVLRGLPAELHARFRQIPTHRRALSEGALANDTPNERPGRRALDGLSAIAREPRLASLLDRLAEAALDVASAERAFIVAWTSAGPEVRARAGAAHGDLSGRPSSAIVARALREGLVVSSDAVAEHDASSSVHALALRSVLAAALPGGRSATEALVVVVDDRLRAGAFDPEVVEAIRVLAEVAGPLVSARLEVRRARHAVRGALRREEHLLTESERQRALLDELGRGDDPFASFVHTSPSTDRLVGEARRLAGSELSVVIVGETGVGKDLLANAIHRASLRRHEPFVAVRADTLTGPLAESRLFGHVRGAFTGAEASQKGLFELAHRGTLYLDSVEDLAPDAQARLLRVLVDGEVRPLGSSRPRRVDVRVIAAMRTAPADAIATGTLREDLHYRLAGALLLVPPLRERSEDLDSLIERALARAGRDVRLTARARDALHARRWPGNVRELDHTLAQALLASSGPTLDLDDLGAAPRPSETAAPSLHARRDALTREVVLATLEAHHGNRTHAARALGVSRFGLQKILRRLHAS